MNKNPSIDSAAADGVGSQGAVLAAVCLAALVLPLSFSGAAMATPAIGRDLGGSAAALTWITNAFMLSFGSLLMAAGALADAYGRKRVFAMGMTWFTLTSVALSAAPGLVWLDLLRALQGAAAAAALSGGSAALAQVFQGAARLRAFSLLGTSFGVGLAFGPVLAGWLIGAFGWRSIFLSTTFIGILALAFGLPRMRESRNPAAAGLDWPGAMAFTAALTLFTAGVIQAPQSGWTSPLSIVLLAGSVLCLAGFVAIELHAARPMLDLTLFRYARFVGVQVLPIGTCYCYIVLVVLLPLCFVGIQGASETQAGILMIALSAPMLIVPLLAASLTRWISAGALCGFGFILAAVGLVWLGSSDGTHFDRAVAWPMLLIGSGAGLPWGLMDGLSVSVVPMERAGMATGIFGTMRVAGEGMALAIVSAVLAALIQSQLHDAGPVAALPQALAKAAQFLAAGDPARAALMLPQFDRAQLVAAYALAWRHLLHGLAALTVLSAIAVLVFLRGTPVDRVRGEAAAVSPQV